MEEQILRQATLALGTTFESEASLVYLGECSEKPYEIRVRRARSNVALTSQYETESKAQISFNWLGVVYTMNKTR